MITFIISLLCLSADCTSYDKGPIPVLPDSNNIEEVHAMGSSVYLVCEGFYGPDYQQKSSHMIQWHRYDNRLQHTIYTWNPELQIYNYSSDGHIINPQLDRYNVTIR